MKLKPKDLNEISSFIIQEIGRYKLEREILFIGPKMEKYLGNEYMQLK